MSFKSRSIKVEFEFFTHHDENQSLSIVWHVWVPIADIAKANDGAHFPVPVEIVRRLARKRVLRTVLDPGLADVGFANGDLRYAKCVMDRFYTAVHYCTLSDDIEVPVWFDNGEVPVCRKRLQTNDTITFMEELRPTTPKRCGSDLPPTTPKKHKCTGPASIPNPEWVDLILNEWGLEQFLI